MPAPRGGRLLTNDPLSAVLAAVATGAVLGLLVALYREHREPFLFWAVVAWAASLLQFVAEIPRRFDEDALVWTFPAALAVAVKSLSFLAAGVAYRSPAMMSRWAVGGGAALAVLVAAIQTATWPFLPTEPAGLRELPLTLTHAAAIIAAGFAFWPGRSAPPRPARPLSATVTRTLAHPLRALVRHGRGARILALSLLGWGVVQLGFLLPLPANADVALLRIAGLLQGLQSLALVMLVLDRARQRADFMRSFNQKLLDGMDLGLALVGPDLRIQHTNRWMTERFGADLPGRSCVTTYLARPEQCPACPWRDRDLHTEQLTVEGPGSRVLMITCSPLRAADGSTLLLELVSDVTEQDAMRARLVHSERLATVGEMASRVAHEIRNPLAIMNVHADLARREFEPGGSAADGVQHLDIVKNEIRRVAGLVDSYLRFGRLPPLVPSSVDVDGLVTERLATLAAELDLRGITVQRTTRDDVPAILADHEQLGQALMNLVRNAIEAMPHGGTLGVTTSRLDGHVMIEVSDTGLGVGPDDVERIFRPFHTTKPLGGGLGLALAREIAQAHGGSLTCRSQAGGCFLLALPVRETAARLEPEELTR